jgi:hypothetical protein
MRRRDGHPANKTLGREKEFAYPLRIVIRSGRALEADKDVNQLLETEAGLLDELSA